MQKYNNTTTCSTIDEITAHLNLSNIIGNVKARTVLRALTCAYFEEKLAGKSPNYPVVLLTGATAKRAFSSALANSFGMLSIEPFYSDSINRGGDCMSDILCDTDGYTALYIGNANKLMPYSQKLLWQYLQYGVVEKVNRMEERKEQIDVPSKLVILGADNITGISSPLYDSMIHCVLISYSKFEMVDILKQRAEYYGLSFTTEQVLEKIAEQAGGICRKGVKLVELCHKFMLAGRKDKISLIHLNQVIMNYCNACIVNTDNN